MSGDPPRPVGGRRLSVPVNARRFSSLAVPGAQSPGPGGHGSRRLSALIVPSLPSLPAHASGARRLSALVPESVVRRLSNVSSTLGIGKAPPQECLVEQGKALCALYMRSRIRSAVGAAAGVEARAMSCTQLSTPWAGARAIFPRLSQLGRHLERARPRLYSAVGLHAVPAAAGQSCDAGEIAYNIGMELFKEDITWGKIISLMAVCGALASEPRANSDLNGLIEAAGAIIRGPLHSWLADHGGWYGLLEHSQPAEDSETPPQPVGSLASYTLAAFFILLLLLVLMWILLRDLLP